MDGLRVRLGIAERSMLAWLLVLVACKKDPANGPCGDLCDVLVNQCHYEAFPSYDSCIQGCEYDDEQGSDISAELDCVQAAQGTDGCDTFAVVECEHD